MEPDIGIAGYLTSTPGVGGVLKAVPEDFVVEERSTPPPPDPAGDYTIATIRTRGWETNRLVRQLSRSLRISRRRIGFAGTKDKRAVSVRRFSFSGLAPESLEALHLRDMQVTEAYRSSQPLEIGDLWGNSFRILVRDLDVPSDRAEAIVDETSRQLTSFGGFPNFFGVQRFGSVRPITHEVGRELVRGDFRAAVNTYVAHPIDGEDAESFRVRTELEDSGDVKRALRSYPRSYSFEKALLNHLSAHPDDVVGALGALPPNLLMLFVHAYQSYLFNRILSDRLRRGLPFHEPVVGDIVLAVDAHGLPDRDRRIEVEPHNLERVSQRCRAGKAWVSAILFGSEVPLASGVMGEIERSVVHAEGLSGRDFIIPEMPRMSSKGTRREILAPMHELSTAIDADGLHVSVALTRGAYATCLVREFTKTG